MVTMENDKYKKSNYNTFVKTKNGEWVCFNSISNALAKIDDREYENVRKILNDPNDNNSHGKLKETMIKGRFLIPEECDEIKLLKTRDRIARFNTDSLNLLILVTEQCNFRCIYCYENHLNSKMSKETMERLLIYLEKESNKLKSLSITWFGGEPLLVWEEIVYLTEKILEICKKNKCEFGATIITNGYLLTGEKIKRFADLRIKKIQVTIDGTAAIHDPRRPLVNGGPTFDVIIKNLRQIPQEISVNVRINIDKTNQESIKDFLLEFSMFKSEPNFYFSLMPVDPTGIKNTELIKNCFESIEFAGIKLEILDYVRSFGLKVPLSPSTARSAQCMAVSYNQWIVDSEGTLFKCYLDLGDKEKAVGKISNNGVFDIDFYKLNRWLGFDPFSIQECLKCRVLPLCLGGCDNRREKNLLKESNAGCNVLKLNLEECIKRC